MPLLQNMSRETAADLITNDVNFFGTMMVVAGDADGMVSGAIHTTAATIRPALQARSPPPPARPRAHTAAACPARGGVVRIRAVRCSCRQQPAGVPVAAALPVCVSCTAAWFLTGTT
jgi:hypothetical protein